ncbi:YoaK family protein [Amycolatopsis sp. NPDC059657]|uniref:YoaK family protein n=1 Tax=Amycolatopsis sp. NPDC059657 TaxID=3346899 RepID=UPI0036710063
MTGQPRPWDGSLLRGPVHGPLPILLVALTFTTGIVDAVSVLGLGRVFVANMTGNVVFLGFALAGAPGFALLGSLAALIGFLGGALAGGALIPRLGGDRRRVFLAAVTTTAALQAAAVAVLLAVPAGPVTAAIVSALLAVGFGLQNSVVRHLAVPDLTTTVLTMTLTGIAADLHGPGRGTLVRRVLAVVTMLAGALLGALLVDGPGLIWPLVVVLALQLGIAVVLLLQDRDAPWVSR